MKLFSAIKRQMLRISFTDPAYLEFASQRAVWLKTFIAYVIIQTGMLAGISAYVAAGVIVDSEFYALLLAIFWGLLIVSFDRGIFLAKSKWMAGVRLVLALFIGIIVSVPLELHILGDQIHEHLKKDVQAIRKESNQEDKEYRKTLRSLEGEEAKLETEISKAKGEMKAEKSGYSINGRKPVAGKGKEYEAWKLQLETLEDQQEIITRQIERLNTNYKTTEKIQSDQLASVKEHKGEKLLSQLIALKELENVEGPTGDATRQMSWSLRILFVLVEIFPALLKLSLPTTDYDTFQELVNGKNEVIKEAILLNVDHEIEALNNDISKSTGPSFIDRMKTKLKANKI